MRYGRLGIHTYGLDHRTMLGRALVAVFRYRQAFPFIFRLCQRSMAYSRFKLSTYVGGGPSTHVHFSPSGRNWLHLPSTCGSWTQPSHCFTCLGVVTNSSSVTFFVTDHKSCEWIKHEFSHTTALLRTSQYAIRSWLRLKFTSTLNAKTVRNNLKTPSHVRSASTVALLVDSMTMQQLIELHWILAVGVSLWFHQSLMLMLRSTLNPRIITSWAQLLIWVLLTWECW